MTPGQDRLLGTVLALPLALIILIAGTSIYTSEPANPLGIRNMAQVVLYVVLAIASVIALGVLAYWMREHRRARYGMLEVLLGVGIAGFTLYQLIAGFTPGWAFLRGEYLLQIFASVYFLIRGFVNIGHGVENHPVWAGRWRWLSLRPPLIDMTSPAIPQAEEEADAPVDEDAPVQQTDLVDEPAQSELTPEASKAARDALEWSLRDLAENVGITFTLAHRFETTGVATDLTKKQILAAYVANNVEFIQGGKRARIGKQPSTSAPERSKR